MAVASDAISPFRVLTVILVSCCFFLFPTCPVLSQSNHTENTPWSQGETYQFAVFNSTTTKNLTFYGSAAYDQHGALQLTPLIDGSNESRRSGKPTSLANTTGLVVLNQRFSYANFELPTIRYASFSTIFDMSLSRDANRSSEDPSTATNEEGGMSFVVLELTRYMDFSMTYYRDWNLDTMIRRISSIGYGPFFRPVIAVEFDPDGNQVAFRSRSSRTVVSLDNTGLVLSPPNGTIHTHTVWIDHDESLTRVYIANQGNPKPASPVLASDDLAIPASLCAFGLIGSTGNHGSVVLHTVTSWMVSAEIIRFRDPHDFIPYSDGSGVQRRVIISTSSAAVVLLVLVVVLGIYVRKKKRESDFLGQALRSLPGMPKEFKYAELKKATDNFSQKNKLGRGGFGEVYKGKLPKEQKLVAVKKFLRETDQGGFLAELTIINRLRHRNLVRLLGWSYKNKRLLLVYEYMPNGSLDNHIFNRHDENILPWECRYKILADVASALHYLHNEYNEKVIHRDLKASNIMLDADFNAFLGDFGLARAIDNGRTSYVDGDIEGMPGTWGYIAPECLLTGKATRESDVFGFGAVVLEVVSGCRPGAKVGRHQLLVDWVWELHKDGKTLLSIDPRLKNEYEVTDAQRLIMLGLACSHPMPAARPKAHEILQIISKSTPPPTVPLVKPTFMWTSMSPIADDLSHTNSINQFEVSISDDLPLFFGLDDNQDGEIIKGCNSTTYHSCNSTTKSSISLITYEK